MDADKSLDAPFDTSPGRGDTSSDLRLRALLMTVRSALIMVLGALEDYLRVPRSVTPRRGRGATI